MTGEVIQLRHMDSNMWGHGAGKAAREVMGLRNKHMTGGSIELGKQHVRSRD